MIELKDLVWFEEGFYFEREQVFEDDIDDGDSVFYCGKSLEEALLNRYGKKIGWFHKYSDRALFDDELEAIDDALDYAEGEEVDILIKRKEELEKEVKK